MGILPVRERWPKSAAEHRGDLLQATHGGDRFARPAAGAVQPHGTEPCRLGAEDVPLEAVADADDATGLGSEAPARLEVDARVRLAEAQGVSRDDDLEPLDEVEGLE